MPFIRKKLRTNKDGSTSTYYSVVENCRVEGKVKQQVIGYLGLHATVEDALAASVRALHRHRFRLEHLANKRQYYEERLDDHGRKYNNGYRYSQDREAVRQFAKTAGEYLRRDSRQLLRLWKQFEDAPARESELLAENTRLRQLSEVMGITDSEALALPGTQKDQQLYTEAARQVWERIRHNQAQGNGIEPYFRPDLIPEEQADIDGANKREAERQARRAEQDAWVASLRGADDLIGALSETLNPPEPEFVPYNPTPDVAQILREHLTAEQIADVIALLSPADVVTNRSS